MPRIVYQAELDRCLTRTHEHFRNRNYNKGFLLLRQLLLAPTISNLIGWDLVVKKYLECAIRLRSVEKTVQDGKSMIKANSSDLRAYLLLGLSLAEMRLFNKAVQVLAMGLRKQHCGLGANFLNFYGKSLAGIKTESIICSKKRDPLQKLPYDVLELIFSKLDVRSLTSCRHVSKKWCDLLDNSPRIWKSQILLQDASSTKYTKAMNVYLDLVEKFGCKFDLQTEAHTKALAKIEAAVLARKCSLKMDRARFIAPRSGVFPSMNEILRFMKRMRITAAELKVLELDSVCMDMRALSYIFTEHVNLEVLSVRWSGPEVEGSSLSSGAEFGSESRMLQVPKNLKILELDGQYFSEKELFDPLNLCSTTQLTTVRLSLPNKDFSVALPASLQSLELCYHGLALLGGDKLFKLRHLKMTSTGKSAEAMELAKYLIARSMTNLTWLYIVRWEPESVKVLCRKSPHLRELYLKCANMCDADLIDIVKWCPKLEVVHVHSTLIGSDGARAVASAKNIKSILLMDNALSFDIVDLCNRRKIQLRKCTTGND